MNDVRRVGPALLLVLILQGAAQVPKDGFLGLGGFRCIDLRPFANDHYLDLYQTGFWSNASFRMDIWKRMGVPYWYPAGAGNIRVAGTQWRRPGNDVVSAAAVGAVAEAQQPGNGAIANANDGNPFSYWYAGDNHPSGKLLIKLKNPQPIREVRFLAWSEPRHAPKDYTIGLILSDGRRKEIASVRGEKRRGEWISFPAGEIEASGVYLDVATTMEGEHGPVVYELQARGQEQPSAPGCPSEVLIPLHGLTAKEVFFLGQVGGGFDTTPDVETPVGEYVFTYQDGRLERVPLIAGKNVASTQYGNFVPEAQFAWGLCDPEAIMEATARKLNYHLDDRVEVEPKRQLMVAGYKLGRPDQPLRELTFRCTNPKSFLILQCLTLLSRGEKMNALFYNGRRLDPTPKNAPGAGVAWSEVTRDQSREIRLDGDWRFCIDPGNMGIRHNWFAAGFEAKGWGKMPVPSQWYAQRLDYHGVVWFRRKFKVPKSFPGKVLELDFQRVDYDAHVWVNGKYVGRHKGAYSSFKLDATKAIRKGAVNEIVVRVDSPIDPGYEGYKTLAKGNAVNDIAMPYAQEGSMGGIYRSVFLIGRGEATVRDVWTWSEIDPTLRKATVKVSFDVETDSPAKIVCRLTEPATSKKPRRFEAEKVLSKGPAVFSFDIDRPLLWWPWEQGEPNLHMLDIQIWKGDVISDRQVMRIGIKQVTRDPQANCLVVNHHRIFINGTLNDDIHWQSLMDRRAYKYRIQLQKDANLNLIRLTTHESSPEFYELCDEMGMMVWQEMPLQWSYSSSSGVRADILKIVTETVKQTRPHACVIGYSAWNEGGQYGFTDQITRLIAGEDPSRPMSRASGGGDWDVHVYPTQWHSLSRRTPLWSGLTFGFISETGAYGISDLAHLRQMFGDDLFRYGGAEYFWETFASYRHVDGPAYMEYPPPLEWPIDKIESYVYDRVNESERFFWQAMKSMFETARAQRFDPTTSLVYCRFDDAFPTAFLGMVNFVGQPLKSYYGVKEACQQVLPIVIFDSQGASDVRVVNEYWTKGWKGCRLDYVLRSRDGKVVKEVSKTFDLPEDAVAKVLTREEIGDLWHVPGGFSAELKITGANGKELSENHYDMTADEVHTFVTCLYPLPPMAPCDSTMLLAKDAIADSGVTEIQSTDCYGPSVLALEGRQPTARFTASVDGGGEYSIRAACSSGALLHQYSLYVDGARATLESYLWLDMNEPISRGSYSSLGLAWYPGWTVPLSKGPHAIELRWEGDQPAPRLVLDAIAIQPR